MRMRVLLEPHHGATYEQILALARATERYGFDAFFRSDHYLGIDSGDTGYLPTDSWTTLAGLAVQTERVRLGTLMTASTFRRPGPLAVAVATVDAMSGGRARTRDRSGLVRAGAPVLRYPVPGYRRALRPPARTARRHHRLVADARGRAIQLPRPALPAR